MIVEFITQHIPPSAEVLLTIPTTLSAICLNSSGLQSVVDSKALPLFLSIFTVPKYASALRGRAPSILGNGVGELIRHHPSLKPVGVDACVKILDDIYTVGVGLKDSDNENITFTLDCLRNIFLVCHIFMSQAYIGSFWIHSFQREITAIYSYPMGE